MLLFIKEHKIDLLNVYILHKLNILCILDKYILIKSMFKVQSFNQSNYSTKIRISKILKNKNESRIKELYNRI